MREFFSHTHIHILTYICILFKVDVHTYDYILTFVNNINIIIEYRSKEEESESSDRLTNIFMPLILFGSLFNFVQYRTQ